MRPLGFEYRSKLASPQWRNAWDWTLFVSGFVPMLVFGAAIGNILNGVPFHFSWNLTSTYTGSFISLFNPFAILCGALSVAMSVYMGAVTIMNGGEGAIYDRARKLAVWAGLIAVVLFTVGGVWISMMQGYHLVSGPDPALAQTPLQQSVERAPGAWLDELPRPRRPVAHPGRRLSRHSCRRVGGAQGLVALRLVDGGAGLDRHSRHRRRGDVPVHAAVEQRAVAEPHGLECVLESIYAWA